MLDWASEVLLPDLAETVMPSPAELSRLGVWDVRKLAAALFLGDFLDLMDVACMLFPPSEVLFLVEVLDAMEAAVGGRELTLGGWGKAPMLTVFRTALLDGIPAAFSGDRSGVE